MKRVANLVALLLSLMLSVGSISADTGVQEKEGKLDFLFGTLYVPQDLIWDITETEDGKLFVGRAENLRLVVGAWQRSTEVSNTSGMKLLQEELVVHLENAPNLRLQETLLSPYPWPESLELRLNDTCAYLGSEAEKTLLIVVQGKNAEQLANRISASFKESVSVRRRGQEKSGAGRIRSMLGTSTTLLLLAGFILPAGLSLYANRRKKTAHNPFIFGLWGLGGGAILSLLFSWMMLSRFSWTRFADYGATLGDCLARFLFLFIVCYYFSRRWRENRETPTDHES